MEKLLKFILVVVIWFVVAAIIIGGALVAGYEPIEHAIYLFAGIIIVWYCAGFLWRLVLRYRAKRRVEKLVSVAEPKAESRHFALGLKWWREATDTERRFKSIIAFLKSSSLREHGDPLYVLPWYFVIGDTASRQEQLLDTLQLPEPSLDSDLLQCEKNENNWHLTNDSVLIEVPESYRKSSTDPARPEWVEMLSLLASRRSAQPLDGMVLTVSVQSLLSEGIDALLEKSRTQRRLVEDCQQLLAVQAPVSLLLTGLDRIDGMAEVLALLTPEQQQQVLGQPAVSGQSAQHLALDVVRSLSGIVHQKILLLLKQQTVTPQLLRLSKRLDTLEKNLGLYCKTLFEKNLYEHTPVLNGLYISSQQTAESGNAKSTQFVHDLFTQVLPQQRHQVVSLASHKKNFFSGHKKTVVAGVVATAATLTALTGAYRYHHGHINDLFNSYYQGYDNDSTMSATVNNLLLYRSVIDSASSVGWLPWYQPFAQTDFLINMKGILSARVDSALVSEVDKIFSEALGTRYFQSNIQDTVDYIGLIVRQINILKAVLAGAGIDELSTMPPPYDVRSLGIVDQDLVAGINALYLQSLVWEQLKPGYDVTIQEQQLQALQATLQTVVSASDNSLDWIVVWLNQDINLRSYSIAEAWTEGTKKIAENYRVDPAFTAAGKKKADDFIVEIKRALENADPELTVKINQQAIQFEKDYKRRYLKAWEQYALRVGSGVSTLQSRSEWVDVANNLGSGRNAYFQTLNLLSEQLAIFGNDAELPDWVAMTLYYQEMRSLGPDDGTDNDKRNNLLKKMLLRTVAKAGPVGKAISKSGKKALKTQKKLDKASKGKSVIDLRAERLEQAAELLQNYRIALNAFVYNAEVRSESFKAVSSLFAQPDNPAKGEGAYAQAYAAVQELQALVGKANRDNRAFWSLYMGSLDFMRTYMISESSCYLNEYWRDEFLADLESVPAYKKDDYLLSEGGSLWTLLDTQFKPFVKRRLGAGFAPQKAAGSEVGLSPDFYNYISKAQDVARLPGEYKVAVKAMPTSVNPGAIHLVEQTSLVLNCSAGPQQLHNHNFPVEREFQWSADCGDTSLLLRLGHLKVQKTFVGATGFADFLQQFENGSRRFYPDDFEQSASELNEFGIQHIDVRLQLRGAKALVADINKRPPAIPKNVSSCWL